MPVATLPAPFGGIDVKTPVAALQSPYCKSLFNFNTTTGGLEIRKGDSVFAKATDASSMTLYRLIPYGSDNFFIAIQNTVAAVTRLRIYSIAAGGTPTLVYTHTKTGGSVHYLIFNKNLFLFGLFNGVVGTLEVPQFNGSTWGLAAYTWPTDFLPAGGTVFKNRAYIINSLISADPSVSSYGYTEIDATAGAITEVPLAGVLSEYSTLSSITTITLANNTESVVLLAFIFFSGEVLFYKGSYPDSNDWGLAGRAKISSPLGYGAVVPYGGDALVMTTSALVSLRELFLAGNQSAKITTFSDAIDPLWKRAVAALNSVGISVLPDAKVRGVWNPNQNQLIISFPAWADDDALTNIDTRGIFFVFDTLRSAWTLHQSNGTSQESSPSPIIDITTFDEATYIASVETSGSTRYLTVWEKSGADNYTDRSIKDDADIGIEYEMISAPLPFPKTAVYSINGIEPIIESDLHEQTKYNLVADFGAKITNDQKVTQVLSTSIQKPLVNIGVQATHAQVKMHGTTVTSKTVGLDLYSFNVWFDKGEDGSR